MKSYDAPRKKSVTILTESMELNEENEHLILDILSMAKATKAGVIDLLKQYIQLEEVCV